MPARVLLADDHTLVAEGFRRILERHFEVVGIVGDGESLVREALRLRPDVILVDISLPVLNGLEAAHRIRTEMPDVKLVFLTMHSDIAYLQHAMRLGASGYVLKKVAGKELVSAVHEVLLGRTYVSRDLTAGIADPKRISALASGEASDLSPRQMEILRLLATGMSHHQIAAAVGITPRTVKFHRSQIEKKLGLSGAAALIRYAINHGIVESSTQT